MSLSKTYRIGAVILTSLIFLFSACDDFDGDVTAPSYLKIDSITVADNSGDSWSSESGFFTSKIDAVQVVIWVDGDTAETNLGTFHLPCTIPVLRNGNIDRVLLTPVVQQDGIANKRIYYPYYELIELNNVRFAIDSVTDLGTLQTHYKSKSLMKVHWQEFFEPGPGSVSLDSVVTRLTYKADTVCSGYGCGVVRVPSDKSSVSFWADTLFYVPDPSVYLYLEMDYWSDFDFSIGLYNPTYDGGPNSLVSHMTLYGKPEKGWQKIYINIGSIWSRNFNSYQYIRPYFTIFNNDGKTGNLFIDNIKLVTI